MVAKRKKKYEVGEGSHFLSRKSALKKLQLTLKQFRRLCIIKGIYPREPNNRRTAQKGVVAIQTLYHKKDIQFLMHEPIIWKLREYKIFAQKVGRARAMKDFSAMKRYLDNHPSIKIDHIVKERYPTFIDALKDLDDCLTLCFLFGTFPSMNHVPRDQSYLCQKLTVEFMHAIIAAKALRKVFVSIKGYYYQAEISGHTINWIVPHNFSFAPQIKGEVDFKIMSHFVEFYTIMLGFVNFRLYHSLNIYYPPKFTSLVKNTTETDLVDKKSFSFERIAALNQPLCKTSNDEQIDQFEDVDIDIFPNEDDSQKLQEAKIEQGKIKTLKTLFRGLKFYINREVPREPLVFVIRCFGGEVSWNKVLHVGSTFDENDETITHHIVDRPSMDKQYISRYYVQPQWVFDSVNTRSLLPCSKYFMGAVLPPHLSPFVEKDRVDDSYIPPEEQALTDPELLQKLEKEDGESSSEDEEEEDKSARKTKSQKKNKKNKLEETSEGNAEVSEEMDKAAIEQIRLTKKQKMVVTAGEVHTPNSMEKKEQEKQEFKLREKMIPKKHRHLYKSMMKGRNERAKETSLLQNKRRQNDKNEKVLKKKEKQALKARIVQTDA